MNKKIMLVDDVDIANIIMKKLLSLLNVDVDVFDFTDAVKAYESIKIIQPDLIFLDLNMPWLDGWQFLEKMRKNNYHHKVIILTSSTSILDREHSSEFENVVGYCEKPLSRDHIFKLISAPAGDYYLNLK